MRLFVAIGLSDEIRKTLTGTLHEMKQKGIKGNYQPVGNLHLTLAFLGEVRNSSQVSEALQSVQYKPFRLGLDDLGSFGDVLWMGVKGNQALNSVARDVRSALDAAGISYDTKKFTPHITLIRKMTGNWKQITPPRGEMMVRKISLMKSEQKDGRMVYTQIDSF